MRTIDWDRPARIASIREDVWRFVSQTAHHEEDSLLEAATLLQMSPHEVRTLAGIHFIASPEVARLLEEMPGLVRRLRTTTRAHEEISAERLRGPIQWPATLAAQATTGLRHVFVTAPAHRAFDTPENRVLVFALDAIRAAGRRTGWHRSTTPGIGTLVRTRVEGAERWLRTRMLSEVRVSVPSPQTLTRVRSGRRAALYRSALDVVALHARYVRRLDRDALRTAIERHALVTSRADVLLEILCGFAIERALNGLGWRVGLGGLVRSGRFLHASKASSDLEVFYQRAPKELVAGSLYGEVQRAHRFARTGWLAPDFVVKVTGPAGPRWLLVEVKGVERKVAESARAALHDLFAYRRAFEPVLRESRAPYGLGIAWGHALVPSPRSEVVLATPDTVEAALRVLLEAV